MGNDTTRELITVSSVEAPLAARTRAVSASKSGASQAKLWQKTYKQPPLNCVKFTAEVAASGSIRHEATIS